MAQPLSNHITHTEKQGYEIYQSMATDISSCVYSFKATLIIGDNIIGNITMIRFTC